MVLVFLLACGSGTDCAVLCSNRQPSEATRGWCSIDLEDASCADRCVDAHETSPAVGSAFDTCARRNPLCFETLESCMDGELQVSATGDSG